MLNEEGMVDKSIVPIHIGEDVDGCSSGDRFYVDDYTNVVPLAVDHDSTPTTGCGSNSVLCPPTLGMVFASCEDIHEY